MTKPTRHHTLLCAIATLLLAMVGCRSEFHKPGGEMRLGISRSVAGYAIVGGEHYGFAADVADTVARSMGCKLRITPHLTSDSLRRGLQQGTIDIAVVPRSERVLLHNFPSESFYTTNYSLLLPSWRGESIESDDWRGKSILADKHFQESHAYASLREAGALCDTTRLDGIAMAQRVVAGKAYGMICERSEAELVRFLYRSLCEVATIDEEECEIILVFGSNALKDAFTDSLQEFSTTEEYATLVGLYFGETSITERFAQLRYRPTRVVGGISVWDEQLRRIARSVGVDWRLMSAMAYHESRFRNDQVSHKGAVGLMQVMPIVAEDLGLDEGYDLADPSTNISLAARLLRRNSRALGFGDTPTTDDQTAIVVASYNCGITRTLEAQRLVAAEGGSKECWEDIKRMMTNMSRPEWIATSDYKMRRFGDAPTTIAYTEAVMALYDTYRSAIIEN